MQQNFRNIPKPVVTALQSADITTVAAGSTVNVRPQFGSMTVVMTNTGTSRTVLVQISFDGSTWYTAATVTAAGDTAVQVPAAPYVRVNQTAVSSSTLSGAKVYA